MAASVGGYLDGLCCSPQTELFIRLTAECARRGLSVRTVDVPVAKIERRSQGARAMQRPNLRMRLDMLVGCVFIAIAGGIAARLWLGGGI